MGEGVLTAIVDRIGTPVYVYDAAQIRTNHAGLSRALRGLHVSICYSVKANSNLAILALLRELGTGVDIVSGGELQRVLRAGFAPETIVFSGVGKTERELRDAVRLGVGSINVESEGEMALLSRVATEERRTVGVSIRINPHVTADTHPYTRTGEPKGKFGVAPQAVAEMAAMVRGVEAVRLDGLAMHIGSQIVDTQPFVEAVSRLIETRNELAQRGLAVIRHLDLGGGLAIPYLEGEGTDVDRYAADVVAPAVRAGFRVKIEPGRFLVGNAGVLLTRVLYRKRTPAATHVVVDAGVTDFIRPSYYGSRHRVTLFGANAAEPEEVVDVVGPVCETGDFLALDRSLPQAEPGRVLAVHDVGAYGFVMSSNYNSRRRPAEVLVDGRRWTVVRERERFDDLMRSERATPTEWHQYDEMDAGVRG